MVNLGFDMKYYIDVMAAAMAPMASLISLGGRPAVVEEKRSTTSIEEVELEEEEKEREDEVDQKEDREDEDEGEGEGEGEVKFYCGWPPGELAKARLQNELKKIEGNLPISCTVVPIDGDIFYWEATLMGPDDSPYEGGIFYLTLRFSRDYPAIPPEVHFKTRIFHPNIDSKGNICLWKDWFSGIVAATILVDIYFLLMEVEIDNMVVPEIADMYVKDPFRYEMMARSWTLMYAKGSLLV